MDQINKDVSWFENGFDRERGPSESHVTWTDDRIELLKSLWDRGFSASQCAQQIGGISRNAVIGKVNRLGLPTRSTHSFSGPKDRTPLVQKYWIDGYTVAQISAKIGMAKASVYKKLKLIKAEPGRDYWPGQGRHQKQFKINRATGQRTPFIQAVLPPELPTDIPLEQRKTLLELENKHCRYPHGDPCTPSFYFCGSPTADLTRGRPYCAAHAFLATNYTPGRYHQ